MPTGKTISHRQNQPFGNPAFARTMQTIVQNSSHVSPENRRGRRVVQSDRTGKAGQTALPICGVLPIFRSVTGIRSGESGWS